MCVLFSKLGCLGVADKYAVLLGLNVPLATRYLEDPVHCRSSAIISVSNGSAWGSLSLVMQKSQRWVRLVSFGCSSPDPVPVLLKSLG